MEPDRNKWRNARWLGLVLGLVVLVILVKWALRPSPEKPRMPVVDESTSKNAMAFVLGWQSKVVLVENVSDKPMRLYLIGLYLEKLDARLPQTVEYYLSDPKTDGGGRAQEFAEETLRQLRYNRDIADHFGIASDIVLAVAGHEAHIREAAPNADFDRLVRSLDIPATLKLVPATGYRDWALQIEAYYESLLTGERSIADH